jgi:hypothetical protein
MLTYNDETVKDALEVFESCAELPCEFWGFKDVGLVKNMMKRLVGRMNDQGKVTFLEVVSLTEQECMRGARIAVDCGFDYLMGTVFYQSVYDYLKNHHKKYLPFCGQVTGHPSVVKGTIRDAIEDGKRLEKLGVDGLDLLAYRFIGNAEMLARKFIESVSVPVVIAGSIDSFSRLDKIKEISPWAFTIGTAFFEKKFASDKTFEEQILRVIEYMESE